MEKLSVVVITKNEAKNIERCLRSVVWADEIVVLDSGSTDATEALCRQFSCRFETTEWLGFGPVKQKVVALASHTWVLSIDADEEVTPELKASIQAVLKTEASRKDAYLVKRKSWYVNRWIDHSGWDKDAPLRLFDKTKGTFNDKLLHESVVTHGTKGKLDGLLLHYTYPDLSLHLDKIKSYGAAGAARKIAKGKKGTVVGACLHGMIKFVKMYVFQAGFLDGTTGLALAINSAFGVYYRHLLLWEHTTTQQNSAHT